MDEVSGSWIKITTPEFKVKDDVCAGGKGLDTPVKISIYATGKSADEYITYPTTISNSLVVGPPRRCRKLAVTEDLLFFLNAQL